MKALTHKISCEAIGLTRQNIEALHRYLWLRDPGYINVKQIRCLGLLIWLNHGAMSFLSEDLGGNVGLL